MIGGVLFEKTVKEVLPSLNSNKTMITKVIASLAEQLTKKGVEINEYKEKHDIRIRGQNDIGQPEVATPSTNAKSNVLVSNN
jgi:prefoldin subunit 2